MAYHKNLGCYNNIIGWAACKEQTLISHSSGCWESEIKAVADSVSGGGSLPRSYMSLHCVLRWWRGRGNSLGLFLKGCLSCSRGFHPHDTIPSQRPQLQNHSLSMPNLSPERQMQISICLLSNSVGLHPRHAIPSMSKNKRGLFLQLSLSPEFSILSNSSSNLFFKYTTFWIFS